MMLTSGNLEALNSPPFLSMSSDTTRSEQRRRACFSEPRVCARAKREREREREREKERERERERAIYIYIYINIYR